MKTLWLAQWLLIAGLGVAWFAEPNTLDDSRPFTVVQPDDVLTFGPSVIEWGDGDWDTVE